MKVKKYIVYVLVVLLIGYVVYVIIDMAAARQGVFKPSEKHITTNKETESYVRPDNKSNVQNENFKKKVEQIKIKTLSVYKTQYKNIEIFEEDKLFRDEYKYATVFAFATKGGKDLINRISGVTLFKGEESYVPIFKIFELNDDNAFIIAVVDNDKTGEFKKGLKIRLKLEDEKGTEYTKQQTLKLSDYKYKSGDIHGGELFKIAKDNYGFRIDNSKGTDLVIRDDVEANSMHYEFKNTFNIFNFGKSTEINPSLFRLEYQLPGDFKNFSDIKYEVVAQKSFTRNEDPLLAGERVLCQKQINIIANLDFDNLTDEMLSEYKKVLDNSVLVYDGIRFPLKHIVVSEKSHSEKKEY